MFRAVYPLQLLGLIYIYYIYIFLIFYASLQVCLFRKQSFIEGGAEVNMARFTGEALSEGPHFSCIIVKLD